MAETLANVVVDNTAWTDINTASGIVAGTNMQITNSGNAEVKLIEASSQPSLTDTRGVVLTGREHPYASAEVVSGSLTIWALSLSEMKGSLSLQAL